MNVKNILLYALLFFPYQVISADGAAQAQADSCANKAACFAFGVAVHAAVGFGLSAAGIPPANISLAITSSIATGVGAGLCTSVNCPARRDDISKAVFVGAIAPSFAAIGGPEALPLALCLTSCGCAMESYIHVKRCLQDPAWQNINPEAIGQNIPPQHFMQSFSSSVSISSVDTDSERT